MKGIFEDLDKKHYSDGAVADLAELLSSDVDLLHLREKLDIAANQYFQTRSMFEDAPTHGESKAALREIQKHAQKLLGYLEVLDDKSWFRILAPEIEASYKLSEQDRVKTSLGYEIEAHREEDGSYSFEQLGAEDFIGAAQFIEIYVTHALETYPEAPRGTKRLLSLGSWLNHIVPLWTELSGKDFTLDVHKGVGISPAFLFCKRAIDEIDKNVTDANLITSMRGHIRKK